MSNQKTRHDLDDRKLGEYLQQYLPTLKLPIVSTKIGYVYALILTINFHL